MCGFCPGYRLIRRVLNLMLGGVERSLADTREVYQPVTTMKSPHAMSRVYSFVQALEEAGFGDVQAVRDFKNELEEVQREKKTEER